MPNGVANQTVYEVFLQDRASMVADTISKSVTGMLNRLQEMKEKGAGVVKDILTRPLGTAAEASEGLRNKLLALGAAITGFLALRKLKTELTEIFNEGVRVESQLVRLANLTGSDQFAEQTVGWAHKWALQLRIPRQELYSIAEGLSQIGINASQFDPSGIIAAGQAAGGVTNVVNALRQSALDPSSLLQLQETFRALPFERLQEIIQTTMPGDFQGRVEALNALFREVYGDTLERSQRSVVGLRQALAELLLQFRETIAGVGSPLFDFFRSQLEKAVEFIQRARPTIQALGQSISQILTETLRSVVRFVDFILERFGTSFEDIAEHGDRFRTRFLIPVTAEIIGFITRIELFAEKAFGTIADFLGKLKDEEWQRRMSAIGGVGGVVLGLLLRRPSLIVGGLALLKIHHSLSSSDTANAEADPSYFSKLMSDIWATLPSDEEGWSNLSILAGMALLTGPLAPIGGAFILGGLINKGLTTLPDWAQGLITGGAEFALLGPGSLFEGSRREAHEREASERIDIRRNEAMAAARALDVPRARGLSLGDPNLARQVENIITAEARRRGRTTEASVSYQTAEGQVTTVVVDVLDPVLALAHADQQVDIYTEREKKVRAARGVPEGGIPRMSR